MNMRGKIFVPLALIALLAAGCNSSQTANTNSNQSGQQAPASQAPSSGQMSQTPAQNQSSNQQGQQSQNQNVVTYTDSGFSPKTLTIKKGETVIFKNTASDDVRVASNPHPIHNGYPTTGGCVSSTFDSCSNIAPGQSWSFKFDIAGSWGYHNHLNPSEGGTIIVK